ncbi:hypothetical protein SCLCIDRAFT_1225508 [Scleroderma citrinum Foug A]|uniref:Uncharacterized protein n=1 Tax=Scleroderma citrinum Foug A TaxID=1036808 RepID=A0A0C2YJN8_9AGAM|nr:hypothetical protein SCLCIDRAFT_1225508 [Scleroderma citrinum Foug A]
MQNVLQSRVISRTPTDEISSTVTLSCDTYCAEKVAEMHLAIGFPASTASLLKLLPAYCHGGPHMNN